MISQSQLKSLLNYNPDTGVFTNLVARHYKTPVGSVAGTVGKLGYVIIKIHGVSYKAHRLAFLYMEGSFPEEDTDHVNLTRDDNRWCNLRRASTSQNTMNRPVFENNKTGCPGVFQRENGRFRVYVNFEGERHHGGTFGSFAEAKMKRDQMVERLHQEFGRFH